MEAAQFNSDVCPSMLSAIAWSKPTIAVREKQYRHIVKEPKRLAVINRLWSCKQH